MKIAYCYNRSDQANRRWYQAEPELMRRHGHEVLTFSLDQLAGYNHGLGRISDGGVWNNHLFNEVCRIARNFNPDIASFLGPVSGVSPSAYWACKDLNIPVVQHLVSCYLVCPGNRLLNNRKNCQWCCDLTSQVPEGRHQQGGRYASFMRRISKSVHMFLRTWDRKIDRYIACSEFTKSQFVEEGLAADKLSVRPNFLYETPSIEIGTKSDFVVYFGELDKSHGVQVLMDAWRLAEKKYKLLVIGSGPLESTVRRMEVESGGEVEYLGHQPPSVVYRILSDAKLCIAPSLLPDVSSRVLVDAYSMGTPVVASDIGGFSENILVGETGWLVEAGYAFLLAT
ncbi:MAG: glycosyltransferase, partial [Planctomycetota bacterium]